MSWESYSTYLKIAAEAFNNDGYRVDEYARRKDVMQKFKANISFLYVIAEKKFIMNTQ